MGIKFSLYTAIILKLTTLALISNSKGGQVELFFIKKNVKLIFVILGIKIFQWPIRFFLYSTGSSNTKYLKIKI